MNVLYLSTCDIKGGAAKAAYRLFKNISNSNIFTEMLVQNKCSNNLAVKITTNKFNKVFSHLRPYLDQIPLYKYKKRDNYTWSNSWLNNQLNTIIQEFNPDIVHLHWVNGGFCSISDIAAIRPNIVWTLHDMWPFTGGCHYSFECERYKDKCGRCPQLKSGNLKDLSMKNLHTKMKKWKDKNITIISPSKWLYECASCSSLFKDCLIKVIPNCIDTSLYKPIDRKVACELLSLPEDKIYILFSAASTLSDRRKGFSHLVKAFHLLGEKFNKNDIEILVLGSSNADIHFDIPFKITFLGKFEDDLSLAIVYSAANVSVIPSIQENLSNCVLESMSCGTPVVAFNIGGMPDMITHKIDGFLSEPFKSDSLAEGIEFVISDSKDGEKLSTAARNKVINQFAMPVIAGKYLKLYNEVGSRKK